MNSPAPNRAGYFPGGDGVSVKEAWKSFCAGYVRFVERQGFAIVLTVCVGIIAGTALWTNRNQPAAPSPTYPVENAALAAQLQQERLRDVSTPTPAPTAAPVVWQTPVKQISVLRSFDGTRLQQSSLSGLWQLHDAVDLRCDMGEIIAAMADGTVTEVQEKGLLGACVTIDHSGTLAQYAGMSLLAGLQPGDPVSAGQTIGFGGCSVVEETHMEPHLHLRVIRDGQAINPLTLWQP